MFATEEGGSDDPGMDVCLQVITSYTEEEYAKTHTPTRAKAVQSCYT
jgi:hypothetical protein